MHGNNETLSLQRPLLHINIINFCDSEDDPFVPEMAITTQKPRKILTEANLLMLGFGCSAEVVPAWGANKCCGYDPPLLGHVQLFVTPWTAARPGFPVLHYFPEFSQTHCHPTISSLRWPPSSSCPQSFPTSGSFPMSRLFDSGGQSIRASDSASVLTMIIQG